MSEDFIEQQAALVAGGFYTDAAPSKTDIHRALSYVGQQIGNPTIRGAEREALETAKVILFRALQRAAAVTAVADALAETADA